MPKQLTLHLQQHTPRAKVRAFCLSLLAMLEAGREGRKYSVLGVRHAG